MNVVEAMSGVFQTLSQDERLRLITDMKSVINNNPALAIDVLRQAPQLAFLLVQSLLTFRMATDEQIATIVDENSTPKPDPTASYEPSLTQPRVADAAEAAIIRQVIQLTPDQFEALPPDQRNAVEKLKKQVADGEILLPPI
jgi:cleavage stimulation factor subunit 2